MKKVLLVFLGILSFSALAQKKPALVVGIVVDQMRYEYLNKFYDRYSDKGFKRLIKEGINCTDNHYNYAPTVTAAGHASVYTGTVPAVHGILGNDWIEVANGKKMYCVDDSTVQTVGSKSKAGLMSPKNMFTSTITDQLKMAQNYKSKTIAIALKDRGSILPGGHTADAAYWYDSADGYWITSSFYTKELPTWVQKFNLEGRPQKYINQGWNTLYPIATYTRSAEDDSPYESKLSGEKAPVFPHDLKGGNALEVLRSTPYGNNLTKDFAIKAIEEEHLGKNGTTDFLAISFSSTDYVGHSFGPQSIELEDTYLRLDQDIADILTHLDAKLGKNQYLVFLTADHAVAEIPSYIKSKRLPGGSFDNGKALNEAKAALKQEFGDVELMAGADNYQIYLNHANLERLHISKEAVAKVLEKSFKNQAGFAELVDMRAAGSSPIPALYREMIINGYNQSRSGDFMYLLKPQWFSGYKTGTSHSTVYAYDTHVPLLFFGWNVAHKEINQRTHISDIASTLANWLKINEPSGSIGKVIQ
ncbi:alkaline phosphatase PafA [Aquirufa sp. KTFRIE-69F]|uniref:Alkaline phosphatase PafA n=1 Tax=Aquirufa originis TaxID=3096514 RepID=A0ABW6D6W4_9BACT